MGTVRKAADNTYYVRYDAGFDDQGERIQKFKGGFKREKDAKAYLAEQESSVNKGTYVEPHKALLCNYLTDWLKEQQPRLSPTTYAGYEVNIRCHINPHIGGLRLQEIKPLHIRKLYAELQKDRDVKVKGEKRGFSALSNTSVRYVHRVLGKALEDAFKDEIIHKNPVRLVTPPSEKKFDAAFLSVAQIKTMLDKLKGDDLYMPVMLSAVLGLRRGEVLGLQWKDVDFKNKVIRIRNNYTMAAGKPILREKTKTDKSRRDISVTDRVVKELKAHKKAQKIRNTALPDFVCRWADGEPFNPSHISRAFKLRMDKHGLPAIRFHDLRHSNATLMLAGGVETKTASARLGHSSTRITQDLYTHAERSMDERAAEKIDVAIWGE